MSDAAVRKEGFTPLLTDATFFWRVALYRACRCLIGRPALSRAA